MRNVKAGVSPERLVTVCRREPRDAVLMPAPCSMGAVGHKDFPAVI